MIQNIPEKIGLVCSSYVKSVTPEIDQIEIDKIQYCCTLLFGTTYKFIILFIIAAVLRILAIFTFSFLIFALIRTFAGGIHLKSEISCLITSGTILFLAIYMAPYIRVTQVGITIIFTIAAALFHKYAPGDTELKPIKNKKIRHKFRWASMAILLAYYMVAIITLRSNHIISSIFTLAVVYEAFMISPSAYIITKTNRGYKGEEKLS